MRHRTLAAYLAMLLVSTALATSSAAELRTYVFADVDRSFHATCSECTLNDYAKVVGSFDLWIDESLNSVEITRFDATLVDPIREMYSGGPASWIGGADLRDLLPGDVTTSLGHFVNSDLVEFEPIETPHANPWQAYTTRFSLLLSGNNGATFNLSSIPHVDPDGPIYYSVADLRAELVPEPGAALLACCALIVAVGVRPFRHRV